MEPIILISIGLVASFFSAIIAEEHTTNAFGDILIGVAGSYFGGVFVSPHVIMDQDFFGNSILLAGFWSVGFLVLCKVIQLFMRRPTQI
jgi:uncharacterized membrane protein YeaQ/YmgE (transglycosylase-associated protein family)